MDSTNFQHQHEQHHQQQQHHHHLQDHFVGCSPLNNLPLSSSGYSVSTSLDWNPNIIPTTRTSSNIFCNKLYEYGSSSSLTNAISPIIKNDGRNFEYQSSNNNNFPKNEDDQDMLSSFPSFSSLITSNNPTNMMENSCTFNGFSSGTVHNNANRGLIQFPLENHKEQSAYANDMPMNNWINGLSFPSTNNILHHLGLLVSSPNNSATSISSSSPRLGFNMQAMDLLGNNSNNTSFGSYLVHHEEVVSPAAKIIPSKAVASGTKRASGNCSSDQPKATTSNNSVTNKKSHLKVSCPPFKVRKEKLGDRIAALHQLVSPFGKTDTASVLTEAIGYIQFLQDQIHTLCMPHPKPPRNKLCKPFQMLPGNEDDGGRDEESRIDIRRRGLCLVPVSWTSYITPNQMDASNTSYY